MSVGATDVDWLIPEFWRSAGPSGTTNPSDRELMAALSVPDTLLKQLEPALGPYMMGNDTSIDGDDVKTRYSVEILRQQKPAFMTIHLSSLDSTQHEYGPFSAEAISDLEAIDEMVSRLADAAHVNDPSTVVAVVSFTLRSRSPQKALAAALCSAAYLCLTCPTVGITSRKRGVT